MSRVKRGAEIQITKDNPGDDEANSESDEGEGGDGWTKASEEVLQGR
jgi:hypothetical protein